MHTNSRDNYTPMTAHGDWDYLRNQPASVTRAAAEAQAIRPAAVFPTPLDTIIKDHIPATEGVKHDSGKPEVALVPSEAVEEIAKAFTFGAKKYAANNWRKGFAWTRVSSALLRHVYSWLRGEKADPESGLSHLAHAGACLCFLLTFEVTKTGTDDRYVY